MRRFAPPLLAALLWWPPAAARAQTAPAIGGSAEVFAGGELEAYLRTLSTLGVAPPHQASLRKYSPVEARRLLAIPDSLPHPWAARLRARAKATDSSWARPLRPSVGTRYNSSYPWGVNDGAVWAGRGATVWTSAGAVAQWRRVTLVANPVAFVAQNADFPIMENGYAGRLRFENAQFPGTVDLPQRFGSRAYGTIDPGESTLRIDAAGVSLGVSTAHEWWGPTQRYPYLLGTNAAGFPQLFLGSARPIDLRLLRVHGRVLWGRLDQSTYYSPRGEGAFLTRPHRFATGGVLLVQPGALPELEVGAARFFHIPWPDSGIPGRYWTRTFESVLKSALPRVEPIVGIEDRSRDGENQLASLFARLMLPRYGFEFYVEFGRDDHSWDGRDLLLAYDYLSSTAFGFAKAWRRTDGTAITRLRGEAINFLAAQAERFRGGGVTYIHNAGANQGHTQRGQLLGAGVGVGSAAGSFLAWDRIVPSGRWTIEWSRTVRQDDASVVPNEALSTDALDVVHALGVERLLFVGSREVLAGASLGVDFNRDFAGDRSNVSLYFSLLGWR